MKIIKAPNPVPSHWKIHPRPKFLFLAGSIEMGKAEKWQDRLCELLKNTDWIILNPRRDDWDDTWVQSKDNKQFRQQVEWELRGQEMANMILIYFAPGTLAPISLLELGLAKTKVGLIVCCPEGFYRKGNVDIVCERYGITQIKKLEDIVKYL